MVPAFRRHLQQALPLALANRRFPGTEPPGQVTLIATVTTISASTRIIVPLRHSPFPRSSVVPAGWRLGTPIIREGGIWPPLLLRRHPGRVAGDLARADEAIDQPFR